MTISERTLSPTSPFKTILRMPLRQEQNAVRIPTPIEVERPALAPPIQTSVGFWTPRKVIVAKVALALLLVAMIAFVSLCLPGAPVAWLGAAFIAKISTGGIVLICGKAVSATAIAAGCGYFVPVFIGSCWIGEEIRRYRSEDARSGASEDPKKSVAFADNTMEEPRAGASEDPKKSVTFADNTMVGFDQVQRTEFERDGGSKAYVNAQSEMATKEIIPRALENAREQVEKLILPRYPNANSQMIVASLSQIPKTEQEAILLQFLRLTSIITSESMNVDLSLCEMIHHLKNTQLKNREECVQIVIDSHKDQKKRTSTEILNYLKFQVNHCNKLDEKKAKTFSDKFVNRIKNLQRENILMMIKPLMESSEEEGTDIIEQVFRLISLINSETLRDKNVFRCLTQWIDYLRNLSTEDRKKCVDSVIESYKASEVKSMSAIERLVLNFAFGDISKT